MVKLIADSETDADQIGEVYDLLQLDRGRDNFRLNTDFLDVTGGEWSVRTRSISSLLYYLSQNVETPSAHESAGLVTVTASKNGGVFDWSDTPGGSLFKVRVGSKQPDDAYIATFYRDHWFWIEDNDLQSKSTFMLLRQLFDLQAGQSTYHGPTLTLPVGG